RGARGDARVRGPRPRIDGHRVTADLSARCRRGPLGRRAASDTAASPSTPPLPSRPAPPRACPGRRRRHLRRRRGAAAARRAAGAELGCRRERRGTWRDSPHVRPPLQPRRPARHRHRRERGRARLRVPQWRSARPLARRRLRARTPVQIGVVFPQTELGADAGAVRAYAERVGQLGYAHILVYDHVVGADPAVHQGWQGPYDVHTTFHEPMVLFGYLAALTSLELVTGIIILPQRQTVLAAKQAAEVDLLTRGRFRFGVGLGWNAVEYEALGTNFSNRGRRLDEQVVLLRRLWTEQTVTFEGTYERITGAGLAPLPIQRPIPIWFGAASPPAYRRAGRLSDGWFP